MITCLVWFGQLCYSVCARPEYLEQLSHGLVSECTTKTMQLWDGDLHIQIVRGSRGYKSQSLYGRARTRSESEYCYDHKADFYWKGKSAGYLDGSCTDQQCYEWEHQKRLSWFDDTQVWKHKFGGRSHADEELWLIAGESWKFEKALLWAEPPSPDFIELAYERCCHSRWASKPSLLMVDNRGVLSWLSSLEQPECLYPLNWQNIYYSPGSILAWYVL